MRFINKKIMLFMTNVFLLAGIGSTIANYSTSSFQGQASGSEQLIKTISFENSGEGFSASTTYTGTFNIGSDQWRVYQGNATASAAAVSSGTQGILMRSYHEASGSKSAVNPFAYMNYNLPKITKVVFSARNTNALQKINVFYSSDGATTSVSGTGVSATASDIGTWTQILSEQALTTTHTDYEATISITGAFSNVRLKFQASRAYGASPPTSTNYDLGLDNVRIYGMVENVVSVESISVNFISSSIIVGSTTTATATVLPENASNKTVSWSSSDITVATVNSSSGVVTGVAAGTANIIATAQDGSNITGQAAITVSNQPVTGIVVSLPSPTLAVGSNTTATATISPENATNKTIAWSSLQTNIATINSSTGVITGVALGTATIRATAQDGSGVTGETTITIANNSLYRSYNFLDGGTSSNNAYTTTDETTNISYASDNPTGTSGTTSWEIDYANLSLASDTRIGGKLISTVQTDNTTAWANFKTNFVIGTSIDVVKIYGSYKFGTAGNTTKVYLQKSSDGVTWTTVQEIDPPSGTSSANASTLTFNGFTIEANRYIRVGIALTASATNSGLAFTKLGIHSYTLC
jgi:uncharacterized protein YjdB